MTVRHSSSNDLAPGEPADDAAREQATDPRVSIVLQAPAGSGKTSVLTQRLLRLLAEVEEPEEILAITFTRRAAAEMRARVLKALSGEVGTGALAERLRALAAAVLERSAERGWRLQQDPGRLRIQTIDSFNLRLASRLPLAARAGGGLLISPRPEEQYRLAARETLLAAEADPRLGADAGLWFERLDNQWRNVERMLTDMLAVRAHWLPYLLGHEPEALRRRVGESLGHIVADCLEHACALLAGELRAEAARLPGVGPLECAADTLAAWKALARLALTDKGEWRQRIDRRLGEGFETPAGKQALRECIEALSAMHGARELLLEVAALPSAQLCEADAAALAALSRVLRHAAAQLEVQFASDGRVDHTCIAGAARAALTEEGEPTDLALRAGLSLRHILVDEFQDTSAAQTELLTALTAGWEEGEGRTLFVVGDPMQSIYLFREAEVGCFLKVRDQGIGAIRLRALRLSRNFRSVAPLIEWVNGRFEQLFPRKDALRESAVRFTPSAPGGADAPDAPEPVQLRLFAHGDRAAETRAVIERIRLLKEREPGGAIAVLVAARTHARGIVAALHEQGIDAIGVDLVPLREVPVVRDLVALTRALHDPGDRTAWLAVLRAPWCGASLASLTRLSRRHDALLVWEALGDAARLSECPPQERARIERVREVLDEALEWRDGQPVADWLERAWLALGAPDCHPAEDLPHARAFFEAVSERAAAGEWRGPESLDSVLQGLFARPRSRTAHPVQILTVHHAKGLEFDHVLIPGLDRRLSRGAEPLLRWLDLPREAGGSDLLLSPAPAIGEDAPGQIGPYLKRLEERRAANEQVRLLYVAVTRARRSLHLYAALEARADGTFRPGRGTLLDTLWPALAEGFLASLPCAGPPQAQPRPAGEPPLRRLRERWRAPEPPPGPGLVRLPLGRQSLEPPEFSWVQETARHIGTVVHAALQSFAQAPALPEAQWIGGQREAYREQLRRHGVPAQDLPEASARVLEALTRTVADERGRWILCRDHREACSELALTGLAGGRLANLVIDRCFVDGEGTRWVIDFKTSVHEGAGLEEFLDSEVQRYRGQLAAYAALARGLGAQPVRAGLYFPLLGVFRPM